MPIYEFSCTTCGRRFDKLMKMSDPSPPCPGCASDQVKKLVSASAFVLKGGGWYKDHYGLKSAPASGDSAGGAGKAAGGAPKTAASTDGGGGASEKSAPAAAPPATSSPGKPAST